MTNLVFKDITYYPYVIGTFDTLEEAKEEVRKYHQPIELEETIYICTLVEEITIRKPKDSGGAE